MRPTVLYLDTVMEVLLAGIPPVLRYLYKEEEQELL